MTKLFVGGGILVVVEEMLFAGIAIAQPPCRDTAITNGVGVLVVGLIFLLVITGREYLFKFYGRVGRSLLRWRGYLETYEQAVAQREASGASQRSVRSFAIWTAAHPWNFGLIVATVVMSAVAALFLIGFQVAPQPGCRSLF